MGIFYLFIFMLAIVAIAVIKTNWQLGKYEKKQKDKNNSHHNMMIF